MELVIFDNDGVVVDSELLANAVLAELLTELGHPTTVDDSLRDYLGGTIAGVREAVLADAGRALPPDFEASYHERLFAAYAGRLRPVEGVRAVLDSLETPYCLASSGTLERIVLSLTVTEMHGYFAGRVFSAEQVARGKPAPDLFLHAASSMSVPPARCVVIEDSANGVQAARAAGMKVLGYSALTPVGRLGGADATFSAMHELPALLRGLGP
jgi:HAD superfamily hydrolase (TIGR01509 family)